MPDEKKVQVMEMAIEHAREVFSNTGIFKIEYFEYGEGHFESGQPWYEFNVQEPEGGCGFDEDSLRKLENRC